MQFEGLDIPCPACRGEFARRRGERRILGCPQCGDTLLRRFGPLLHAVAQRPLAVAIPGTASTNPAAAGTA